MKVEMVSIEKLIPYSGNARTHSAEQINQIAESIKIFGWTNPVLIDGDKGIIAGHGRILAARQAGIDKIPCIELNGMSESEKKAYIIADNKLALNAGWDDELLKVELDDLFLCGFDATLTGFTQDELNDLTATEVEGLTDDDAVPEPPANAVTKLGDVWLLGNHRLMCGDSTSIDAVEKLMDGRKADMVFTDPPYGVSYTGNSNVNTQNKKNSGKAMEIKNDTLQGEDLKQLFQQSMTNAFYVTTKKAVFYIWYATSKSIETLTGVRDSGLEVRAYIFWYKVQSPMSAFMSQYIPNYEPLLYCFKSGSSTDWYGATNEKCVWEQQVQIKDRVHPTQKPVELPERALSNSSKQGDTVLDLFGGSGSTLIACEKTGRKSYLMELDPKYCDVIVKRWEEFTGKKAVLENEHNTSTLI